MPKSKKIGKIVGLIIVGVLLAGFLTHTYFNYSAGKELEQELAAIRDSGCPMSLADFAPPPVPDEENVAVLYKRAFDMFDPGEGEQEAVWKKIRSSRTISWSLPWNLSSEEKETIKAILDKNRKVYELLKEASSCKRSRLPADYGEDMIDLEPLKLGWLSDCIRFLAVKALIESDEGKIDDALETCRVNLHLTNVLYPESIMLAQIIRIICQPFLCRLVETVFEQGEGSLSQCRVLLEEMTSYGTEAPLVRSLESLRCFRVGVFKRILKGNPKALGLEQSKLTPRRKLMIKLYASWIVRPILKKDFAYFLREQQKLIASHKFPCAGKEYMLPRKLPRYYMFARWALPRFTVGVTQAAESEALARACQLTLATIIYRKEKGIYPQSLEQLSPTIIKELPKDPFSGGDFLYRQEKEGFIVYSAGKNLKNDGGEGDDIIWNYKK